MIEFREPSAPDPRFAQAMESMRRAALAMGAEFLKLKQSASDLSRVMASEDFKAALRRCTEKMRR